jgi:hypothetical protein
MFAVIALLVNPVTASRSPLDDPDLDTIMKLTPAGFVRAENDRLPTGPMSVATFNAVGVAPAHADLDDAVFYGASYERADGALIVFLGMSTSHRDDARAFAEGVSKLSLTDSKPFLTEIPDAAAVEGVSNGARASAITFARNGRGFAVIAVGEGVQADGVRFATFIAGLADSMPLRSDAKPVHRLGPEAVAIAASIAIAMVAVVASWQFMQRRRSGPRDGGSGRSSTRTTKLRPRADAADTIEHPLPTPTPRPSPRPSPRPQPR